MTPDVVVDIGNSRMKWGRVYGECIEYVEILELNDPEGWFTKAVEWGVLPFGKWTIASVNPQVTAAFVSWLEGRSLSVDVVESYHDIPLNLDVEHPETVGLDRLFACCAARNQLVQGTPFLVVQAGTALVVNYVSAAGSFAGGAILPGLSLMAKSLHEHTAQLPEVSFVSAPNNALGRNTDEAIRAGVYWGTIGAIRELEKKYSALAEREALVIVLTGGDAELLAPAFDANRVDLQPNLVLKGILSIYYARPCYES